jgi:DNA-binding transcriptional LysR family regulator
MSGALSLHKLEIFGLVAQAGSFSRAAEQLLLSQSAVSQHVQDLEAALGNALFVRGARGVTLTDAGETLLRYTWQILDLAAQAELAVTDVSRLQSGAMTLGATPGVSAYLLPEWIDAFSERYPHLTVSVHTDITSALLERIRTQHLRVAIVEGDPGPLGAADGCVVTELEEFPQYVVVGARHAWWGRRFVNVRELHGEAMVTRQRSSSSREWIDRILAQHKVHPHVVAEFDNLESIKRSVAARAAFTVLPEYIVHDAEEAGRLRRIEVRGCDLRRALHLLRTARGNFTPIECAFFAQLGARFPVLAAMLPVKR